MKFIAGVPELPTRRSGAAAEADEGEPVGAQQASENTLLVVQSIWANSGQGLVFY